jgi:hypothetical protein
MVVGDHLRCDIWTTGTRGSIGFIQIGLVKNLWSITALLGDPHNTPGHLDSLARQADDAFDQIALRRPGDLVKHYDIATVWVVQPIRQFVDKHTIARLKRCRHRLAFNHKVGENKATDNEGNKQRDSDDRNPVKEGPRTR